MSGAEVAPAGTIADVAQVVWLGGADRLDFLQRMSTNRLVDLRPGQGRATVIVTDTGRAVDIVACHEGESGAALVTSGIGAAGAVTAQLRRYILYGDNVRATDASDQVSVFRIVGPGIRAAAVAAAVGIEAVAEVDNPATAIESAARIDARGGIDADGGGGAAGFGPGDWVAAGEGQDTVWLMRHPWPGGLGGFDVVVPAGAPAAAMRARLAAAGMVPWSAGRYDAERVAAALPAYGAEFGAGGGESANPLELGLKALVDFGKGCYIGQEVIARLENYERVQRRLVRLRCAGPVRAGDTVRVAAASAATAPTGRRRSGRITTTAAVGAGGGWALALMPAAWLAEPAFDVLSAAGPIRAITAGPVR